MVGNDMTIIHREIGFKTQIALKWLRQSYDKQSLQNYSSCHETDCVKVKAKPHNVAKQTEVYMRVKTDQNSQRSKASKAVLVTSSRAVGAVRLFRGLGACSLVTAAVGCVPNYKFYRLGLKIVSSGRPGYLQCCAFGL
jgi:hypothetical protein